MQLFEKAADYRAFEQVLRDTLDQSPMRICTYAVMPNHQTDDAQELDPLRRSVQRGCPFGQPEWQKEIGDSSLNSTVIRCIALWGRRLGGWG